MPEPDQNDAESLHSLAARTCQGLGLRLTGALPAPGGGFKRMPEIEGAGKERPGWLSIFADNQGGIAGNWKTGERMPFFLRNWHISALPEAEREARRAAVRRAQTAAEKRRKADAEQAATRAEKLWARGKPVPDDHPYLTGKGVAATPELRLAPWGEVILVPLRNVAGNLRSLQLIGAGGAKRFLRGGELRGHFWSIGVTGAAAKPTPLLICEGVSTGLTLHQATGLPVAAAMSWHNLSAAASALWAIAKAATLLLCADDDWQVKKPVANPGLHGAKIAAAAISATVVLPCFAGADRFDKDTDFNDMAARQGLAAVADRIRSHLARHSAVTAFSDEVPVSAASTNLADELDCIAGGYRSSGGRISWEREGGEPLQLANFAAKITGEIIVDDGIERSKRLEIRWRMQNRSGAFQIPTREFGALHWPMDEIGAGAVVAPGASRKDQLRAAIQYLSGDIPRRHIYAQTGWREKDGAYVYLHNDGAIGAGDVSTELRNGLQNFKLPEPPARDAQIEAIKASLRLLDAAPDRISCPLFAAIYRAPLQRSDFSLVLVGQSGSGKSSIAALAQAHYGAAMAERNGLPADWSSTANALEFLAFQAADALLVIDEGEAPHGSPAARAELDNKISRILRAVGNQATRSRMMADGRLVPDKPPRALVIATKEEAIQGFSLTSRTLTLALMPGEAAGGRGVAGLTPWQTDAGSGVYARAMSGYIAWLGQDLPARQAAFRERFEAARSKLADRLAHPRTADILAQLAAAARLFLQYAQDASAVTKEEAADWHRRILAGLIEAASEQITAQSATDPVETFLDLLRALLASGRAHLRNADGERPSSCPPAYGWRKGDFGYEPQGDLIGWLAPDGGLYLLMDVAFAACQRLARETGQTIEVGPTALRKRIDSKGLILTREGGKKKRLTNRVIIAGAKITVLHLTNPLGEDGTSDTALAADIFTPTGQSEAASRTFRSLENGRDASAAPRYAI